jgi:two-component system, LytTR family, sensor kinase
MPKVNFSQEMVRADPDPAATSFPPVQARFSLRDWRLWAVSFGFFWALYICGVGSMFSFRRAGGTGFMTEEVTILPLIQDTIFAVLAPLVFVAAARYPFERAYRVRHSFLYVGGGVLFTIVHVAMRVLCYPVWESESKQYLWALIDWKTFHFSFHWPLLQRIFLWNLVEDVFAIYIPIVVIAHAALYYRRFRERELRAAQLQAQLSDAKLLALKNQLQPHFLFNTLHSISSLMLTDVRSADTMIARLSDLLRMSLEDDGTHLTTLKRELDFTQAYLDIEKIRFGDRLSVIFEVSPEALDAPVPHLLLQPLVENSIKHGISRCTSGGEIAIRANLSGEKLRVTVTDRAANKAETGTGVPKLGIGLRGTRERLQTLYGDEQGLEIRNLGNSGVEVEILLPFRQEARLIHHGSRNEGVAALGQL